MTKAKGQPRPGQPPQEAWTAVQDERLHQWRVVDGLSTMKIAEAIGRSEGAVSRRCRTLGYKAPVKPKAPPRVIKPPPPVVPKAGLVTLPPLPSLEEPLYIIPRR